MSIPRIPSGAIGTFGEADRSPAYKRAREDFVSSINYWLKVMVEFRDRQIPLSDGTVISNEPLIRTTGMGKTRAGRLLATEYMSGIAIIGDGVSAPLTLHAVRPRLDRSLEALSVTGSDPLAQTVYRGRYELNRQTETVAQVSQHIALDAATIMEHELTVRGDGGVYHRYINPGEALNVGQEFTEPGQVAMAVADALRIVRLVA